MEYVIAFFKALGMFIVGLTAFRIMGSQAVGRLTGFDLVVVIAIGALMGAPLADKDLNPLIAVTAITGLVIGQVLTSWYTLKSSFFEKLVVGEPIKLIEKGLIQVKGLRQARLTKKDLIQELRVKGLQTPVDVELAYLETCGKLSVIKREKQTEDIQKDNKPN